MGHCVRCSVSRGLSFAKTGCIWLEGGLGSEDFRGCVSVPPGGADYAGLAGLLGGDSPHSLAFRGLGLYPR